MGYANVSQQCFQGCTIGAAYLNSVCCAPRVALVIKTDATIVKIQQEEILLHKNNLIHQFAIVSMVLMNGKGNAFALEIVIAPRSEIVCVRLKAIDITIQAIGNAYIHMSKQDKHAFALLHTNK